MGVSAVMIVKNGAATIARALESLRAFDDVVVYDNGSTDGTQAIAAAFANVRLIEGEFFGFGPTKNHAAAYARHDWVFIIDSDEAIDETMSRWLLRTPLDPQTVYVIRSDSYYKEIRVRFGGWSNKKVRRLYNRTVTRFNDNYVHETILDEGLKSAEVGGRLRHYTYSSIDEFILKADRYSTLYAEEHVGKKRSSPLKAFFNGLFSFVKTYFFKGGFLDGYVGLLIAYSHMTTNFYKYLKLYERNREAAGI